MRFIGFVWLVWCVMGLVSSTARALPPVLVMGDCPTCEEAVDAAGPPMPGAYIPQCEPDGTYSPTQCNGSTGYCWCVDECGEMIPGTSGPSWQSMPDCEAPSLLMDVDEDGSITVADVAQAASCLLNYGECLDFNGDGHLSVADLIAMLLCIFGFGECV